MDSTTITWVSLPDCTLFNWAVEPGYVWFTHNGEPRRITHDEFRRLHMEGSITI